MTICLVLILKISKQICTFLDGSVLLQDDASHAGSGDVSIDMTGAGSGRQLQNQMQIIDEQDAYIQSRAETMQNIETTIVELGSIFQQLAHMVKEQEEIVGRLVVHVRGIKKLHRIIFVKRNSLYSVNVFLNIITIFIDIYFLSNLNLTF